MSTAKEIMNAHPFVVAPDMAVQRLAKQLFEHKLDGACVVENSELIGVVTAMDLVYQEKSLHLPTVVALMDAIIPLESGSRTRKEMEKMTGAYVRDIMTSSPVTVGPDSDLKEIATLMVERHITILPVVKGSELVGTITKPDVLQAAFRFPSDS
jgi:CBS domain-containing protein